MSTKKFFVGSADDEAGGCVRAGGGVCGGGVCGGGVCAGGVCGGGVCALAGAAAIRNSPATSHKMRIVFVIEILAELLVGGAASFGVSHATGLMVARSAKCLTRLGPRPYHF